MSENDKINYSDLFKAILSLKTEEDCQLFFSDLCTYKELDSMAQRIKAARLLLNNETYEEIIKKTDISSATLSRVSRCVKHGEGYKKFLK
ncbi:MAG: YerC/YecD family TrpR-related protein [Clostridia bacterium]|nr:YerC/YecD family TrpR-related protein [Clostridia bacterium]